MENYGKIVAMIQRRLPGAEIYMMAYYPVNEVDKLPDAEWAKGMFATRTNENIRMANEAVEKLAGETGCHYIDADGRKRQAEKGVHHRGHPYVRQRLPGGAGESPEISVKKVGPISVCPASAQKTDGRITRCAEVFCRNLVLEGQMRNLN